MLNFGGFSNFDKKLSIHGLLRIACFGILVFLLQASLALAAEKSASKPEPTENGKNVVVENSQETVYETDIAGQSIFTRAWQGGFIVFSVLMILAVLSVLTWAVLVSKFMHFRKIGKTSDQFIKSFWDSRSLNDLNSKLSDYPYSPTREVFRSGYAELVRGSQLREQTSGAELLMVNAAIENLTRAIQKAKQFEKRRMEKYLSILAISASASPFIGLFGTVWGIMGAFEGIARTGSASLAAVAPGISEALIATAFGLAAAIPAVIGYNLSNSKIRGMLIQIDGFAADFLNIVERYLVTERPKSHSGAGISSSDKL